MGSITATTSFCVNPDAVLGSETTSGWPAEDAPNMMGCACTAVRSLGKSWVITGRGGGGEFATGGCGLNKRDVDAAKSGMGGEGGGGGGEDGGSGKGAFPPMMDSTRVPGILRMSASFAASSARQS